MLLDYRLFMEDHGITMNRLVHVLANWTRVLIIGASLAILPWLGSMYFCSQSSDLKPMSHKSIPPNAARIESSQPRLLPGSDSVHNLLCGDSQPRTILPADYPTPQTSARDSAVGPDLAEPGQSDKSKPEYISPSDIVSEDNFDQSSADSSPWVWMPQEMPITEKKAESSPEQAASPDQLSSAIGLAFKLLNQSEPNQEIIEPNQHALSPNQQVIDSNHQVMGPNQQVIESNQHALSPTQEVIEPNQQVTEPSRQVDLPGSTELAKIGQSASDSESSPWPNKSETTAKTDYSAESSPVAQDAAMDNRSPDCSNHQEQVHPSTGPFLTTKVAAKDLPVRSEQLESLARQADQLTRHGLELAGRGAYFAARSEFIAALRLVAQGLDTEGQTKIHGKSLAAGLTALKEAEDFLPGDTHLEADLDLPDIIACHSTAVLKDADKSSLTTLIALKSYSTYAQEQLARAAGNEVAGSMALRALGKLHEELAKGKGQTLKAAAPKAIVFYQASLMVCAENFMAANDLGVMLARNGHYEDAQKMLEYSLSLNKQSTVWHNLAVVCQHLGQGDKARQAEKQASLALEIERANQQRKLANAGDQVRWVDENTFSQTYNHSGNAQACRRAPPHRRVCRLSKPVL